MTKEQLPKEFSIKTNNSKEATHIIYILADLGYSDIYQHRDAKMNSYNNRIKYWGIRYCQDFIFAIRVEDESWGKVYTYSEFLNLISRKELTELPEKWLIKVTEENKEWLKKKIRTIPGERANSLSFDYYVIEGNFKQVFNRYMQGDPNLQRQNYPELTIEQLKQYFNKMKEKQEKWVECIRKDYGQYLTIGKKYKVEEDDYTYYYIKDDFGLKGGFLIEKFKEVNSVEKEETNYYKLINDYPGRKIGDTCTYNPKEWLENFRWDSDNAIIPKDFQPDVTPKWFEPVYKSKEIILQIGNPSKKVKISKGKIEVEGYQVSIYSLHEIIKPLHEKVGAWSVKDIKFQIGCSWFNLSEIQQVINKYNEFLN